jgi:hypothetical protein
MGVASISDKGKKNEAPKRCLSQGQRTEPPKLGKGTIHCLKSDDILGMEEGKDHKGAGRGLGLGNGLRAGRKDERTATCLLLRVAPSSSGHVFAL